MIFDSIQVDGPNAMGGPRLEPRLIKLLVMNRHDVRNAAPLFCPGNDGESPICGCPSDIVVNEPDAVSVREANVAGRDRVEVIHWKSVDEI